MNTRRLAIGFRALLCVCLLPVIATACGGKKDGAAKSSTGAPLKVFTHNRVEAYKTLDPMKQFDQSSAELIDNVYDRLLQYNYLKRPYQLEPNLLAQVPVLDTDGLTYSFELRKDVFFHDDACFSGGKGRQLVADDVIYSIKRFADANVNILSYPLAAGTIEGMDAFREQTRQLGKGKVDYKKLTISGLHKVDDQHFTIKLAQKNSLALFPLATAPMSIVPHEAVEHYKDDFDHHPVGTGPFTIKQISRRGVIVLAKNPRYHGTYPREGAPGDAERGLLTSAGKRLPLVDEVHLPLIEESQTAMLKFLSRELDWVAIDRDNFQKLAFKDKSGFHLKPEYAKKFVIYAEPDLSTEYIAFNMKDPLLGKNKALREAIAHALDAAGYVEQIYNGRGDVQSGIVPLGIAGSEREVKVPGHAYDLELAKKKLAEAGFPGGKGLPPITVEYRSASSTARQQFEFIRENMAQAGIALTANFQTFSAFLKRMEAGNYQMVVQGWGADYPDAENFYQLLYSANKTPGPNSSNYEDAEYDKLFEQIRFMPNGPERFALFSRMNEIVARDLPVVVIMNVARVGLYQPWVENFKRTIMLEVPAMYLDIDTAEQAKNQGKR